MPRGLLFAAIAALLMPGATLAQSTTGLTLKDMRSFTYSSMVSWAERDYRPLGLQEIAKVDGMVFVELRAIFDVPWTDALSRLSISSSDIVLVLPDGTENKGVGAYEYFGMLHFNASSASVSRPSKFPDADADLYWDSIFLVPEGTTTATLRMPAKEGEPGYEGPVTIFAPIPEPDAASFATFSVSDTDRFRVLKSENGNGPQKINTVMTAPPGFVFADLEVEVAALSPNEHSENGRFYFHTYDFRLVTAQGIILPPVGERWSRRVMDSQFNGVTPGKTEKRRMIWIAPENAEGATLYFGDTPVAQTTFSGTVADDG